MTSSTEHDSRVWQTEPLLVVDGKITHNVTDKRVLFARHHESDGEPSWMRFRSNERESSQRPETPLAFEVHVQNHTPICIQKHISESVDPLYGIMIAVPEFFELGEFFGHELAGIVVGPNVGFPAWMNINAALHRVTPSALPAAFGVTEGDMVQNGGNKVLVWFGADLCLAVIGKCYIKIVV